MKRINTPLLGIITLALFLALAWYSRHYVADRQQGYDTKAVETLLAQYKPLTKKQRLLHDQAKALREVYMIKAGNENINIFGE